MEENSQTESVRPKYAGFWLRVVANMFDGTLFGGISYILGRLVQSNMVETVLSLVFAVLAIWFNSSKYQGTPGKMCVGIKVTDLEGNRIPFLRSIGRSCVYYPFIIFQILGYIYFVTAFSAGNIGEAMIGLAISLICVFVPIVGILMIAFTCRKQGLHDKLANTLVVLRNDY